MAEQPTIVVSDSISSDGSGESWILLDEMDEAMNEIDDVSDETSTGTMLPSTVPEISIETAEVAAETYQLFTQIEDIHDNDVDAFAPKIENISSDSNETCPSDDSSDSERMYSSPPYDRVSVAPTLDDGSTTDGSISMISESECHRYDTAKKTKPKRKSSLNDDTLNTWMNCKPINMQGRCVMSTSVEGLALGQHGCVVDEVIHFLERLNNFFATTYLGQVFLLFVTIVSLTSYSIICYRYSNIKLAIQDLDQKYFDLQVQSDETDVKLAQCQYLYERELENRHNERNLTHQSRATQDDQKINAAAKFKTNYQVDDYDGSVEAEHSRHIQPTKSTGTFQMEKTSIDQTETISTFDMNENGDDFEEDFDDNFVIPSVRDRHGRIVWIGHDEPPVPSQMAVVEKPFFKDEDYGGFEEINEPLDPARLLEYLMDTSRLETQNNDNILSNPIYDIETDDNMDCKPIERGIISSENYCNNDATQKYIQDAHIHHTATKQHKSMDETKWQKEHKQYETIKTKWDKSKVKYNDNVDKYRSSSDEEHFEERKENKKDKKEKNRHNKIHRKDNDKENTKNNNKNRKESKKYKDDDKEHHDSGAWNKADRKRAVANTHEHHRYYDD